VSFPIKLYSPYITHLQNEVSLCHCHTRCERTCSAIGATSRSPNFQPDYQVVSYTRSNPLVLEGENITSDTAQQKRQTQRPKTLSQQRWQNRRLPTCQSRHLLVFPIHCFQDTFIPRHRPNAPDLAPRLKGCSRLG